MKNLIFTILFAALFQAQSKAQCVLSSTTDTQAEVLACLASCGCNAVVIPTGVTVNMTGTWDLTSAGDITFTIEGTGSLVFSGNGGSAEELKLSGGSTLIITNTSNTTALVQTGGTGLPRITFGTATPLTGNDFAALIAAGGANASGALPVELVSFDAKADNSGDVKLQWSTAMEINMDYFEIERSQDTRNWEGISSVASKGNAETAQEYVYTDRDRDGSARYYRLKMVEKTGDFSFSPIRKVTGKSETAVVTPNPFSDRISISTPNAEIETGVELFDTRGQLISTTTFANTGTLETADLPMGIYFVKIRMGQTIETRKLVKN